uniref:CRIB domain-containing protein n=1 Tax=Takifugu rubripes TaxID=31033 RepID=A0A674P5A5_TAKRU
MPILKQLVSNSNQSKRRSRADLTAEMISAPLGDFRHTMHVGRGGDAFGDTSFLSTIRLTLAPPDVGPASSCVDDSRTEHERVTNTAAQRCYRAGSTHRRNLLPSSFFV